MNQKAFFLEQVPHTEAKTRIVVNYFRPWAQIVGRDSSIVTYLDLFSGPGYFDDGSVSTPVLVLREAAKLSFLKRKLHMHFYEANEEHCDKLRRALEAEPFYHELEFKPVVHNETINKSLVENLPVGDSTFTFIDPCGYTGISDELLSSVIRCWGSDCIFFLSVSGILRNIESSTEEEKMEDIFGKKELGELRAQLSQFKGKTIKKQRLVLSALQDRMEKSTSPDIYFLPFGMEFEDRKQLSHCLVFVTKNHRGFALMKDIMAKVGLSDAHEMPLYLFSTQRSQISPQETLALSEMAEELKHSLLSDIPARSWIRVKNLLDQCHKKKYLFTDANMKNCLRGLESERKIETDPPASRRRVLKGLVTVGDKCQVRLVKRSN